MAMLAAHHANVGLADIGALAVLISLRLRHDSDRRYGEISPKKSQRPAAVPKRMHARMPKRSSRHFANVPEPSRSLFRSADSPPYATAN
jgi:hypothetical protein